MFFSKVKSISTSELATKIQEQKDIEIIDVREKDEFKGGHIKEAKNIPLSNFDVNKIKKQPLYVICQSGMRSKQAYKHLSNLGYDVTNVSGGMNAWKGKVV
ncbi:MULTISPECIES: rhodanese-like domain-containing protein [unclassified Breznakia]|uniref:rhodanese-like domain-containing protein n=1 Tax=unclassified Breznakia TaxID=2623764 RepID=UPI002476C0D2|nr:MULTISPECIES: rhodanese-like domain-containing protein [unclassified Breznakia]MDH6367836.1 rhodanese-related sulfurtransferase [Breznakia sp. PH1-1]MDH6404917.1 rhodanese-related sulfurtransferase [Breznakia sp. PF1-11]MDH6412639.1 rhodanese-related sulfurtransferase [Breznakia sp. PFB1-11]MDH6414992.1 rhodanese-related sulfurtransferase [Breznakia sp. PFB1-14]MDH6417303.1 rhodanese-related sulfurtransferase [Breznakia sp. PFB1-4]